jgi:hypothetical protein
MEGLAMETEEAVENGGGTRIGAATLGVVCLALAGRAPAQEKAMPLIDFGARYVETRLDATQNQSDGQVECRVVDGEKGKALEVTIQPGPRSIPAWPSSPREGDGTSRGAATSRRASSTQAPPISRP